MRNILKTLSIYAAITCAFLMVLGVTSALAEENSIYVVDVQRVINESIQGKAARNNVEAEIRKSEAKLAKMRSEVEKMKNDLEKQTSLLSSEALQDKKNALLKAQRNLEVSFRDEREDIQQKHNVEVAKVVADIDALIKDLAAKGTYPVIMEKDPRWVIYTHSRLDLTDEIIKTLDAKKTGL